MELPASRTVFSHDEIVEAVRAMALDINARCANGEWLAICVMNGGLMFTAEMLKRLDVQLRLDAIRVSRYHETTAGSELRWHTHPESEIAGQSILLLDDIYDEGETLAAVADYFREQGATEVISAVLVEKVHDRKVSGFRPDYVGLTCEDIYVFGFGMDYEGLYRNLPDIRCLEE